MFILPTIRINSGQYRGKLAYTEVLTALCAAFAKETRPDACLRVADDSCRPGGLGDSTCKARSGCLLGGCPHRDPPARAASARSTCSCGAPGQLRLAALPPLLCIAGTSTASAVTACCSLQSALVLGLCRLVPACLQKSVPAEPMQPEPHGLT